jgi:meiotically up-regulated gene 157 (Mug157) protein
MPYVGSVKRDDEIYLNTRRFVLSKYDPYYCQGTAGEGPGGPHSGIGMIWPLGLIVQALTSTDDTEIRRCLEILRTTHAGTGFMHESFNENDANKYTRAWFAWANTIFGELILTLYKKHPDLLS